MGRSRYKIYEPTHPYFVTCTILNWLPIFTRKESVEIVIQSLKHLQKEENLKLYAYVILENHIHLIVQSVDESTHWRYSSARNYEGVDGLIEVERFW